MTESLLLAIRDANRRLRQEIISDSCIQVWEVGIAWAGAAFVIFVVMQVLGRLIMGV